MAFSGKRSWLSVYRRLGTEAHTLFAYMRPVWVHWTPVINTRCSQHKAPALLLCTVFWLPCSRTLPVIRFVLVSVVSRNVSGVSPTSFLCLLKAYFLFFVAVLCWIVSKLILYIIHCITMLNATATCLLSSKLPCRVGSWYDIDCHVMIDIAQPPCWPVKAPNSRNIQCARINAKRPCLYAVPFNYTHKKKTRYIKARLTPHIWLFSMWQILNSSKPLKLLLEA